METAATTGGTGDSATTTASETGGSETPTTAGSETSTGETTTDSTTQITGSTDAPTTTDPTTTTPTTDTTVDPSETSETTVDTGETSDTDNEVCVDDNRVVAFVANWQACPTPSQLAQYSHVVIAFAVTYVWDPNGNLCDPTCTIGPVDGCSGKDLTSLVNDLHASGQKVLLSFGGAGMGGLWEGTCGQMTKCWDACIDKADSLVSQLTDLVSAHNLDGIDIDYEYCLHTEQHRNFVADLTTGLRQSLDASFPGEDKLVTHAPMDHEIDQGDHYYDIVKDVADAIDFLMPQYYNGGLSPFEPAGLGAIHTHYDNLVHDVFDGDASRVVFGYCIEPGCNPTATQPEALGVTQQFDDWYPQNGGMFFWAHPNDQDGWFSQPFRDYYDADACAP